MDRRKFIHRSLKLGTGVLLASCGLNEKKTKSTSDSISEPLLLSSSLKMEGSKKLGDLGLLPQAALPSGEIIGQGLGGRRYTDLSRITPDTLVTGNSDFFIRTRAPEKLDSQRPWKIHVDGDLEQPIDLSLKELMPFSAPRGMVVLECAGNDLPGGFGLMSAAEWEGVSITHVLSLIQSRSAVNPEATRILIGGYDEHNPAHPDPAGSQPGADWVFTREQLEQAGAFLATRMNGEPLPVDNGFPLRLVVPGWYACTHIKWVNRITFFHENCPSTPHMHEYTSRIHQEVSYQARDYAPALIEVSATPIRLEKWKVKDQMAYRLVGLLWGGGQAKIPLEINFGDSKWNSVEFLTQRRGPTQWTVWSFIWEPSKPGIYTMRFRVPDLNIPAQRLGMDYYSRQCRIDEV